MDKADKYAQLSELLSAGLAGDNACYRQFLGDITPIIRGTVSAKLSPADAEDVVQEVLIAVHKARHTYDSARPIMPWLMAITRYKVMDQFRRLYSQSNLRTVDIDLFGDSLEDVTNPPLQTEYLDELLKGSSPRDRKILNLIYVEGYSAKEAGQKLGMGESAVKVAAHRALKKIRNRLDNENE